MFTFCVLATLVLVYYIRRRYHLFLEIRQITVEQLWNPCFQNHLKNMKIKCMINNFVIILLFIEIVNNFFSFFICFKGWVQYYKLISFIENKTLYTAIYRITFISRICYVPILCMVMRVLWLAYLHWPYKHTIIRWTAYIALRVVAVYSLQIAYTFQEFFGESASGQEQFHIYATVSDLLFFCLQTFFECTDILMYVYYSRRLYLHLKSRQLEAKLFYDRRKYLENKYTCIHFKVATILVCVALVFYLLSVMVFYIFNLFVFPFFSPSPYLVTTDREWVSLSKDTSTIVAFICRIIYRILLNLNYLYVFLVILLKYCRQKSNLTRINDTIRPMVRDYQEGYYCRRRYKYF